MKLLKQKNNTFKVESSSRKGKFYIVDISKGTCTCPHYRIRMARIGGKCKHILAVLGKAQKKTKKSDTKLLDFVKKQGEVDSFALIKKFSEEEVDDLVSRGEIIEEHGMIKVLE